MIVSIVLVHINIITIAITIEGRASFLMELIRSAFTATAVFAGIGLHFSLTLCEEAPLKPKGLLN